MKIFIDSADIEEIEKVKSIGILEGVTTNPLLIKSTVKKLKKGKKKVDLEAYLKKLLRVCKGIPVSLEVVGTSYDEIVKEGMLLYKKFNSVARNVYVKVPVNPCMEKVCAVGSDGIKAIRALSKKKVPVNCTLIFTPEQAVLAAKAGAKMVSPFVGREDDYIKETNRIKLKKDYFPAGGYKRGRKMLDDKGIVSGVDLIKECVEIFKKQKIKSEILAASIRNRRQFREVALAGADIATMSFKVINSLLMHEKTAEGIRRFSKNIAPEYAKLLGRK
jgi:transaldolase